MRFTNRDLTPTDFTCDVIDTAAIGGPQDDVVIDLVPAGSPCTISVVDNDENKFTPIRALQANLAFLSTSNVALHTFITDSPDNRFLVKVYSTAETIFVGGLVLNDIQQEFMDDFTYRNVGLQSTDGLGLLKDIPLTKDDGITPKGYFAIIQYIAWCLKKTGLSLPINVMNNLRMVSKPSQPGYNAASLHAKTFEDEIGTCINCYDVLTRIFGEECYLTQWKGEWWIRRIDEMENANNYYDRYDKDGVYLSTVSDIAFIKTIGLNDDITLIQPAALVSAERPHSYIQETFNYEYPREIIDNIDFSRGTKFEGPISQSPGYYNKYSVEDWTTAREAGSPTVTPYIKKYFENDYEKERYVVIPAGSGSAHLLVSNPVPVHAKDKINFSLSWRLTVDLSGSGMIANVAYVRLYAEDGTYWTVSNHDQGSVIAGTWVQSNSTFTLNNYPYQSNRNNDQTDYREWQDEGVETKEIPRDGVIIFHLIEHTASGNKETHFQNLQLEYIPFINGSYAKYNGQHNKVSRTGAYKAKIEQQVYLSDSPKKLFKGALFDFNFLTGRYVLAGLWFNAAVPYLRASNGSDAAYNHPLGHLQAYSVWNQYRRPMRLFDASLDGLQSNTQLPSLLHTYFITDHSPHTNGKRFMLLHFEMDLYHAQWRGVFAEVYDDSLPKVYSDPIEFKYISQ